MEGMPEYEQELLYLEDKIGRPVRAFCKEVRYRINLTTRTKADSLGNPSTGTIN